MTAETPIRGQLPLPLEQRPVFGREDFLIADCNREAIALPALPKCPGDPRPMFVNSTRLVANARRALVQQSP